MIENKAWNDQGMLILMVMGKVIVWVFKCVVVVSIFAIAVGQFLLMFLAGCCSFFLGGSNRR